MAAGSTVRRPPPIVAVVASRAAVAAIGIASQAGLGLRVSMGERRGVEPPPELVLVVVVVGPPLPEATGIHLTSAALVAQACRCPSSADSEHRAYSAAAAAAGPKMAAPEGPVVPEVAVPAGPVARVTARRAPPTRVAGAAGRMRPLGLVVRGS